MIDSMPEYVTRNMMIMNNNPIVISLHFLQHLVKKIILMFSWRFRPRLIVHSKF